MVIDTLEKLRLLKEFCYFHAKLKLDDENFYQLFREQFGTAYLDACCMKTPEEFAIFNKMLSKKEIVNVVEIGTLRGVSTLMLSIYCKNVVTIDIADYFLDKCYLWLAFGVLEKIKSFRIDNENDKKMIYEQLNFDFAFIDGLHDYDGVSGDFEIVKKCGRVLFHDYIYPGSYYDTRTPWGNHPPGIKRLVDSLPQDEVTIEEPFAYWEKKK